MRYRAALIAVTGMSPLQRRGPDEIVQQGSETIWVTEASSTRQETFAPLSDGHDHRPVSPVIM
ncbi:MAG TPA: hypothetical protein VHL34_12405 [Rhizomicrobium sp.]|nr:hypothetical protein [Rhizomicrobium sp.]